MAALGPMRILTDFADEAVILPLIAMVALMLGVLGWRRGALAWVVAVGCSFASVLVLKVVLTTCGPVFDMAPLRSPSGHTAAAAVIAGGIAVALGRGRWSVAVVAGLAALLIGATRVALGLHSIPEVVVGGALGVLGALGFGWLGGRPPVLQLRWLFAVVVAVALLLHGQHLNAETRIRTAAYALMICPVSMPPATLAGASATRLP
jgi:membrane-associated phospholipid phosphatase